MFPKGPRFEPLKVPDVPAPNAYNPTQESHLDIYKRGAFLEKSSRFHKDKDLDVPGPGTYNSDIKKSASAKSLKPQQGLNERYNVLQKKLEDLEQVHQEGKKAHQTEIDKLKSELARCQRTVNDQSERIDKQKKQNDALDFRIQELKKTAQADQTEIKGLKAKLKMVEHENLQLAGKQADLTDIRKAMQVSESKYRDELRERDRRISELERVAASETKKRQAFESKLQDLKTKGDVDVQAAHNGTKKVESQLVNAQQQLSETHEQLTAIQDSFAQEREDFLDRLAYRSFLLSHAAQQYAQLVSSTTPLSDHLKLKRLYAAAELKILRLERKLGNAEDQVMELAHLVRQVNDCNDLLKEQLLDATHQITVYEDMLSVNATPTTNPATDILELKLEPIVKYENTHRQEVLTAQLCLHELLLNNYTLRLQQLFFAYTCTDKELMQASNLAKQRSQDLASALASHEAIAVSLEAAQKDRLSLSDQIRTLTEAQTSLQQTCASFRDQTVALTSQQRQSALAHEAAVKKDKDAIQRLTNAVQKSRVVEDTLRAEIDRLLTELADAERYQEAYVSLSEQVGALVARNQLAEEEAERLGKFNAEILGHNNPAQRIAYVDRIRRELAEAKHKIVMLSREQEAVVGLNADLQHELDMYKSVMTSDKPRTHITRVQRIPLSNVTRSLNASINPTTNSDPIPGDMTLDEIM